MIITMGRSPEHPPRRLYKFLHRKYADEMCELGAIRVGTLYEYRNAELYSGGVLDAGEGVARLVDTFEGPVTAETLAAHSPGAKMILGWIASPAIVVGGLDFITDRIQVPDRFAYCMSESSDWSASSDPDYDACVEIKWPLSFVAAVTHAIRTARGMDRLGGRLGPVRYTGRSRDWQKPLPAPVEPPLEFLKESGPHEVQREWRAVWAVPTLPIESFKVRDRQIAGFARLFATR